MATFKVSLVQRLLAVGPLHDLVDNRVKWADADQATALPYIVLRIISDPRPINLKGYDRSRETRVQADCYAATSVGADAIAQALIVTMLPPTAPAAGGRFGRTKALGPQDLGEEIKGKGFIHRASVDLLIRHTFS